MYIFFGGGCLQQIFCIYLQHIQLFIYLFLNMGKWMVKHIALWDLVLYAALCFMLHNLRKRHVCTYK